MLYHSGGEGKLKLSSGDCSWQESETHCDLEHGLFGEGGGCGARRCYPVGARPHSSDPSSKPWRAALSTEGREQVGKEEFV